MARPKRTDLDELLDRFARMDAEERSGILQALYAADRVLSRRDQKPAATPMAELGERAADDFAKRKAAAELPLLAGGSDVPF